MVLQLVKAPLIGAEPTFSSYPLPSGVSGPAKPIVGPDNAFWFIENGATAQIGRMDTTGTTTNFAVTTPDVSSISLNGLAKGPDGNLWFTACVNSVSGTYYGAIGKMTTTGVSTLYQHVVGACRPQAITAGPDGNMWFTDNYSGVWQVFKITTDGTITGFWAEGSDPSSVSSITAGPDGSLWLADVSGNKITRVNLTGGRTEFTIPTASAEPQAITAGPDGNLWFTEYGTNKIGEVTTSGTFTEYDVPSVPGALSGVHGITVGADGALWFTEQYANKIGRITTSGDITQYAIPTAGSSTPQDIVSGPDGALWWSDSSTHMMGRLGD